MPHISKSGTLEWNFPFRPHYASEGLVGVCHAAKVGCIQLVELKPQPGRDPWAAKMVKEELEMARAWLHDQDLLDNPNGKELPSE